MVITCALTMRLPAATGALMRTSNCPPVAIEPAEGLAPASASVAALHFPRTLTAIRGRLDSRPPVRVHGLASINSNSLY